MTKSPPIPVTIRYIALETRSLSFALHDSLPVMRKLIAFVVVLWSLLTFRMSSIQAEQAAEPGFPTDGLVLWLDASDVVLQDGRVQQWTDKSERANHLSETDSALRPEAIVEGQLPAIRFQKSRLGRQRLEGFLSGEQPFQLFLVMRADVQDAGSPRVLDLSSASQDDKYSHKRKGFWFGYEDYSADEGSRGRARLAVLFGAEAAAASKAWDGSRHIVEAAYAGNQRWALYQDGATVGHGRFRGDVGFLGFQGGSRLTLGHQFQKGTDEHFFQGNLFEVLLFNRVLAADEQQAVGHYLSKKYGQQNRYTQDDPAGLSYEKDIRPLLADRCSGCHGEDDPQGRLDLSHLVGLYRGGTSGPAIRPGAAQESLLMHIVASKEMPPSDAGGSLHDDQVEMIRRWIDAGAPADQKIDMSLLAVENQSDHWAFQRLRRPEVPVAQHLDQVRNPIDRFILKRLETEGLSLSPLADRATLIRRASLDLTGLLPSPTQLESFVANDSPEAWSQLLDRLLASDHFGERWGRHWLDSVGHTDTNALDNDQVIVHPAKGKWRYRDYVVRRFNEDRPYAQFLEEQLAGDELVDWRNATHFDDNIRQKLVATGMLRSSPDSTDQGELNIFSIRYFVLHQTAESLAQNLLGLTMQCCKCHDHKFESISQRDYYRFTAYIMPALAPRDWLTPPQRELRLRGEEEQEEFVAQRTAWGQELAELREVGRGKLEERDLAAIPEVLRDDLLAARAVPVEKRDAVQKYLTAKLGDAVQYNREQIRSQLDAAARAREAKLAEELAVLEYRDQHEWAQAVYDVGTVRPTYVLRRGEFEMPGAEVQAGIFSVLQDPLFPAPEVKPVGETSGRRLQLARQLTNWESRAGALVARVRVNRIWQRLFEVGIVETASNFGVSGMPPTHAELLDWLCANFVDRGTRLKPLLKLIMSSQTYMQQSSSHAGEDAARARERDPENKLLWRQRLRRLEAELIRDSMLVASGRLDLSLGGPPSATVNLPDGMVVEAGYDKVDDSTRWRRSMYLLQRRNYHPSVLQAFDQPLLTEICSRRERSASVAQALMMLNDRFVGHQATFLARRILAAVQDPDDLGDCSERAFQIVLCRQPSDDERRWCAETMSALQEAFLQSGQEHALARQSALARICQTLFGTSEFVYIH